MTDKRILRCAAYCRLSRDDGAEIESASISTQKTMITSYIREHGWLLADIYVDDGYSGTNFNRPDFQRMIQDIEDKKIDCVITKDLSRLGRDYLQCGMYQEIFFPEHGIRYIAINDGYDSINTTTGMDITPFRNILNEMYAADTSQKVRTALRARFKAGEFHGSVPPYGYRKDPLDNHRLIVDERAAVVVRQIYDLALRGEGVRNIRNWLNKQHILRPSSYAALEHGESTYFKWAEDESKLYHWTENAIRQILRSPTYAGNLTGYKRVSVGMKSKKRLSRMPDEWEVVPNTHEGIVSQVEFDRVQDLMNARSNGGRHTLRPENLFAGIAVCGDCGCSMALRNAHRRKREDNRKNLLYVCHQYIEYGNQSCTQHKIELEELYQVVLEDINRLAEQAFTDKDFVDSLKERVCAASLDTASTAQTEQKRLSKRLSELDTLFTSLYEDKALGRISARNYEKISVRYTEEQDTLQQRMEQLDRQLAAIKEQTRQVEDFASLITAYKGITELTRTTLQNLIERIMVYETEKQAGGNRVQQVKIVYKLVGALDDIEYEPAPIIWDYAPILCGECGKPFKPFGARAQFCPECAKKRQKAKSYESKKRSRAEYKRVTKEGHTFNKKVCPICQREFWPVNSGRQTYCGEDCRIKARNARYDRIILEQKANRAEKEKEGVA